MSFVSNGSNFLKISLSYYHSLMSTSTLTKQIIFKKPFKFFLKFFLKLLFFHDIMEFTMILLYGL
jgi:hypothetical protein